MVVGVIGLVGLHVLENVEVQLNKEQDYATTRNLRMAGRAVRQIFPLALKPDAVMSLPVQVGKMSVV